MNTRICTKCQQEKDIEEFSWSIRGIKRHSRCNSCRNEDRLERYHRNPEPELEYKGKREEARAFVFAYLSEHRCVDCGEYDPLVLSFDHIRGIKKDNISQMVNQGYSLDIIREEIEKCEIVCQNCHHRREKKRRGTKYWE